MTTLNKISGAATILITLQLKLDQSRIVKSESNVFSLKPVLFWFRTLHANIYERSYYKHDYLEILEATVMFFTKRKSKPRIN